MFDIVINTPKGGSFCVYFNRKIKKLATYIYFKKPKIPIQLAHGVFGDMDKERTRLAAKGLGYKLEQSTLKPNEACGAEKSKHIFLTN